MITGKTKRGFAFEIADGIGNDFRIVEAIADADSGDASVRLRGTVALVRLLLGEDGKEALYAFLTEQTGGVPADAVIAEVTEVLQIAGERSREAKN